MSIFSDYLTRIKEKRNITVATMADLCQVETTVMFRWVNGERLPGSWEKVTLIINNLRLSEEEQKMLKTAYEKTLFGEMKYQTFTQCIDILRTMQHCRKLETPMLESEIALKELPYFLSLNNKTDILQYIKILLDYQAVSRKKSLYLKMYTVNSEFYTLLRVFMRANTDCNVEELVYLEEEGSYYEYRNIEFLGQLIEMMFRKDYMTIYCLDKKEDVEVENNWILSEDFYMEFNHEMTEGMLTCDPAMIQLTMENFQRVKNHGQVVGERNVHGLEYLTDVLEKETHLKCLEYQPCLGAGLTKDILERRLCKEIPYRELFIEKMLERYSLEREASWKANCIFTKKGLLEFMEQGVVGECPDNFYQKLDVFDRCVVLQNLIQLIKQGKLVQLMIKEPDFPMMEGIRIEECTDADFNAMAFEIQFIDIRKDEAGNMLNDGRTDRFEIRQKRVIRAFQSFWECMQNERYTYNKEETIAILEEVLEEYR